MAEPLKDMFNKKFYERMALEFNKHDKNFHPDKFVKDVVKGIEDMSLNQRMRNTTITLKKYLPDDYKKAVEVLVQVAPEFRSHYTSFVFPDFVGQYGHDNIKLSLDTLKYLTQFGSSEFAIREFLKRDFSRTIAVMDKWAEDKNHHVRRLASEGSRYRLPWSFNLDEVIKNPQVTRSILEKLKADEELYVKKSVANHLNDFSKKQTDYMLDLINSWDKKNQHTAWIIKHASRTLIKTGNAESLAIFEFEKNEKIKIQKFKFKNSKIKLGDNLQFDFDLISEKAKTQKLVIDYRIYYCKKSGEMLPKTFKLKEIILKPNETLHLSKVHRFLDFTTRKHYEGKHAIEIMINGKSYLKKEFGLNF
jgi:3-methyladenine DNA glycosylase AlkC